MGTIRGNAALVWTDSADTSSQRVLLLQEPVRELQSGHKQTIYPADSLDLTQRQVYTVGVGAYELSVRVRFGNDPHGLIDLIKAGSKLTTITYVPNLSDPDVRYACYLISPLSPTVLKMDPQTGTIFGDQDVTLVLRKTDQTAFTAVWKNALLFQYRAGGPLTAATFTRVTSTAHPATYPQSTGGFGGDGLLTTAKTGIARVGWFSTLTSQGPRNVPGLLLESSRQNLIKDSINLGTSNWTLATASRTSGKVDPAGGTKGWLLTDASTTVTGQLFQKITVAAGKQGISIFAAPTTQGQGNAAGGWKLYAQTTNGATTRFAATITWSSGIPTMAAPAVGTTFAKPEIWANGYYRFTGIASSNTTAGKLNLIVSPAGTAAQKGSLLVYGVQAE